LNSVISGKPISSASVPTTPAPVEATPIVIPDDVVESVESGDANSVEGGN
jgi:hypothetical protein